MRKSDKKIDNALRSVLTEVCERALKDVAGFCWLTHTVDYQRYPQSLRITCVFDTNADLVTATTMGDDEYIRQLITQALSQPMLAISCTKHMVQFDSEEACLAKNAGNWALRLQ